MQCYHQCILKSREQERDEVEGKETSKVIVKTVHACPNFEVSCPTFECRGLETAYKDLRQMFQHSDRMFEQILEISFKISSGV